MPLGLAVSVLVSAASAQPGSDLADAARAEEWARRCVADDPAPVSGRNAWVDACLSFKEACELLPEAERARIPRCLTCGPPPPFRRIERPSPAAPSPTGLITDGEACIRYFIKVEVWSKAREDYELRNKERAPPKSTEIACNLYAHLAALRELKDDSPPSQARKLEKDMYPRLGRWLRSRQGRGFKMCTLLALRDAQHYFQNYCDYHEEWVVRNFPNIWCSLTAGYSAGKAIGIVPRTGEKEPTPPSRSEVFWGCSGIWDAQDKKFPYMTDAESGSPP